MTATTKPTPARVTSDVVNLTLTVAGTVASAAEASRLVTAIIAASDALYDERIVLDAKGSYASSTAGVVRAPDGDTD